MLKILDKESKILEKFLDQLQKNTNISEVYYESGSGCKHDFLIPEDLFDDSMYTFIYQIHAEVFDMNIDNDDESLLSIVVINREYVENHKCILVTDYLSNREKELISENKVPILLDYKQIEEISSTRYAHKNSTIHEIYNSIREVKNNQNICDSKKAYMNDKLDMVLMRKNIFEFDNTLIIDKSYIEGSTKSTNKSKYEGSISYAI